MFKYIMAAIFAASAAYGNSALVGTYDLKVNINNNFFDDIFEVKEIFHGKILGTFEVPNIFKSRFDGKILDGKIVGSFTAIENGSEFEVILRAEPGKEACDLSGTLQSEDQVFGTFIGKKRGCDE
ncbi:hypothetical protein [Bacteriovorax sp. Seq25_V]|uniref:hypothetical protein n=1 Tax=Bacteriovorax sp. Seq25_V TaxID=1201288 RepID=UPI00038A12B7|nr:hypothetical protein [Bacteriovorax sp. Seq25_V]EQC45330.1 hypothetical protein M900_2210 [Bacteriovorax sp. Seq25_V]